ncbi:hypothetical protein KIH74_06145 [Kineosporia sp. J2-2]|uniref:Uncharacterized protein n=1 Tax=Kineosporia corallincola TaxID=2835133 RepID=A0ABS5TBP7_9ACTN|nr:hypothetical protein [Kineosporia corallincola]MBT0768497.1 hypothetical protein [Kineosporia corallincola]
MINHTMLVSFTGPIPDPELDQFLTDIEVVVRDTGLLRSFSAQRHIPVPGEDEIPAMIATAVIQFGVETADDLAALFATPAAGQIIQTWQGRHPYRVAWVNHEVVA